MNKYQDALDTLTVSNEFYGEDLKYFKEEYGCHPYDILQELIDKEIDKPTEQEVFKKFEEKGYTITKHNDDLVIITYPIEKESPIAQNRIWIDKRTKCYWSPIGTITMKIHQLLTELFKCWGWFNE